MRERWIDVEGLRVHTVDWEPTVRDAGAPVLLVHGLGGSTVTWELVGPALAERLGVPVRAIDLAGFGRTRARGRPATIGRNAALVVRLLETDGPHVLMGNSMGGAITIGIAARRPELVERVVLVNSILPGTLAGWRSPRDALIFAGAALPAVGTRVITLRNARRTPEQLVDDTLQRVCADPERIDAELRARLVALAIERRAYQDEASTAFQQAATSIVSWLTRRAAHDLARVQHETLIVHGDRDRLVPVASARAAARRYRGWGFAELDGVGHAPQMEAPRRFVDAVAGWAAR